MFKYYLSEWASPMVSYSSQTCRGSAWLARYNGPIKLDTKSGTFKLQFDDEDDECQRRNDVGSPAFLVQSGCGLEESSREPRTPLRSLRVGLLGMWGFLRGIGLVIRRQEFSPAHITITVESAKVGAPCPSCGRVSRSRHSSY